MEEESKRVGTSPEWIRIISRYNKPDNLRSWWQVINSVGSYIILWILMVMFLKVSYLITLGLAVIAAGFMVRIFIIFHDCGHGSFFRSRTMNRIIGNITGTIVFTPYNKWHHEHNIHHQTVGNLNKRGIGDVKTLTVEEYLKLSKWQRFLYRVYRNPSLLIGIIPILLFTIVYRFTKPYMSARQKLYLHLSNLGLAITIFLVILAIGWKAYLLIQIPILYFGSVTGVWLFYVQHQFRDVKWANAENWDYKTMALEGSSLYKLPALLNWFTGSIGYHHIHHLSPLIPNYNLKKCHNENTFFHNIKPITFLSGFESLMLRLWDEKRMRLIGFREIQT